MAFKAKPAPHQKAFVPTKSQQPLTTVESPALNTKVRAHLVRGH
jgi:hypothetical protein